MADEKRLNDEELEGISGGMIFNATGRPEADPFRPWEVINNDNGEILGRFSTQGEACEFAKRFGKNPYNDMIVPWETVEELRKHPHTC